MERVVEVVAVLSVAGGLGWLLGMTMLKVDDKEIRRADQPLDLTGWRGGAKALALVSLGWLSACEATVTRPDRSVALHIEIPGWVGWVLLALLVVHAALAALSRWRPR